MELHHSVPHAKGGEDTYENAIPLCFDCHAEVGHYSDDHPKGTKFTPDELRGHRDHWYAMHAKGHSPSAPTGYEGLDAKLFVKLYELLGGSDGMLHFRDHDYGGIYPRRHDEKLTKFMYYADLPETEFFDAQMASAFADLHAAIREYKNSANGRIWFLTKEDAGAPPEWIHGQDPNEKRFWDAAEVMNKAATVVWEAFTQFTKAARANLKIEL
jgi:hypothetical protein